MRGLEARLQRLERTAQRRHPFREDHELNADLRCLGSFEMKRACDALRAGIDGDAARAEEATSLQMLGHTRRLRGWTQADTAALRKQEWEKTRAVWAFKGALGRRHERFYPDSGRFDVLDLSESEIRQLAEITDNATCASDMDAVADVVGRLRLDGKSMDMASFAARVLRGEIATPPPQPDRQDFLHPSKGERR
jgi:hypothetical protein